jgi:hypothetical protein
MTTKEKLVELYANKSKHSNYQILPTRLHLLLDAADVQTSTRHEKERLAYITSKINFAGKSVIDIGANTGYFSFELLDAGASSVHYYEGNKEHTEFVDLAVDALGLRGRMEVTNGYYQFDGSENRKYDVGLLFNVLHHVGDDYGEDVGIDAAKRTIVGQLNRMSDHVNELVFQLGFNWQGDIRKPLFEHGTKREMINYVQSGVAGTWDILNVGIAVRTDEGVTYEELSDKNIERDDSLGEFLNRPIFILKRTS